jgi:hypothetical protein
MSKAAMDRHSKLFRLTVWLATTSLAAAGFIGGASFGRAQDAETQFTGDPPARVGRLARLEGTISSYPAGSTQWTPAVLNFPFVSGDALWTQPQARADIEVGAMLATLADSTELDLATLDDHTLVASEPQGAVFLDIHDVRPGDTYTINTPRGAVQIAAPGEYEILAGDASTPTRVGVVRGAAQFTSGTLALRAGQGQMAVASGDQDVQGSVEPLDAYDPFLTAMLARNSVPNTAPQPVQDMTGAADLAQYGTWQNSSYGQVWYPQVAPGWVPYRDGSWSYVAPWGWTWVDNEPWGFAPFHYGRWAEIGQRWCWVPRQYGVPEQFEPVYSPALVDFVVAGAVAGAAAGLLAESLSSGRGDVGWVPLGPREFYEPPYGGSRRYRDRLNWGHGWHRPDWDDRHEHDHDRDRPGNPTNAFINRHALTIAPMAVMARSQQIRPVARGFDSVAARGLQPALQPLRGRLPIRPLVETHGLTPQAARRFGLAGSPARPPAPGPAINPMVRPAVVSGGRIPFRGGSLPAAARSEPGRVLGPTIQHAIPPSLASSQLPIPPRPPGRPAAPLMPLLRPHQPNASLEPARPALRPPEGGRPPAPQPRVFVPRGMEQQPAYRPAGLPRANPMQAAPRLEAPQPAMPRIESPRPLFRPEAPRPMMPRPMMPPPMMARPMTPGPMMPPMQSQRPMMMAQPHFEAPRMIAAPPRMAPAPPPPLGRPLHP